MGFAVLFPGQGSQFVGMGADLFDARPDLLGGLADEVLGWSLRRVCLDGPEELLTRTEHAQPALFALSYVLWEELRSLLPAPAGAAGHSLGEYTALVAAGAMDYETGLRLVGSRSRAMAAAADLESSGMAALLGADVETAEAVAASRRDQKGRLYVANLNAPGQVVVAGGSDDLAWLTDHAGEFGIRRVINLSVAGAFHSPFMAQAAEQLASALDGFTPAALAFPVWSNVTAEVFAESDIAGLLLSQLVSPVRFAESLQGMAEAGVDHFVHVGPGDVTAGMARRSVPGAQTTVVSTLDDVGAAAESIVTITNSGGLP